VSFLKTGPVKEKRTKEQTCVGQSEFRKCNHVQF
jgi:hypothetical protein